MAKRQTTDSKEVTVKGRKTNRRGKSALSLRQKIEVQALAKKATMARLELKTYDDASNNNLLVNAGVIVQLTPLGQSSSDGARVGDEVTPKYFSMRYRLVGNTSGTNADQACRVMIIQWYPNMGDVIPSPALVLENSTQTQSYLARNRSGQFKVLYDNQCVIAKDVANADSIQHFDVSIPGKVIKDMRYNDANTSGENQLYLIAFSNEVTNAPRMLWTSRFGYIDA